MTRTFSRVRSSHRSIALILALFASPLLACSSGNGGTSVSSTSGGQAALGGNTNLPPRTTGAGGSTVTHTVGPTGGSTIGASSSGIANVGGSSLIGGTTSTSVGGTASSGAMTGLGGVANSTDGTALGTGGTTNSTGGTKGSGGIGSSTGSASLGPGGATAASGGSQNSGAGATVGGASGNGGSTSQGGSTSAGGRTTGGGTSTTGNGGSSAYAPCPSSGSPCIILPFGDSITDGIGSTDQAGYRSPLFKLIVQANQNVTFVGSRSSGPAQVAGKTFPKNHEGHPGWTIDSGYVSYGDGISTLVPSPAFNTIPHIVLLMIGTNDLNSTKGLDTMADRLDSLLGKIVAAAPNALVVVAAPTPITANPAPSALATYDTKIPGVVQARAAKGQHIVATDMSKMPTSNLSSDGIHPNDQGYTYMASIWYAAIKDLLPQ